MPSSTLVKFTPGTLPAGYCFTSLQQYYEDIIQILQGEIPGQFNTVNFGPNKPDPADQDKPWIRTDAFGNFDRVYTFNGVWLSPNPAAPSTNFRQIWIGAEADLWSTDGGDGTNPSVNTPTDTTGAMWQVDTGFAFRIPIGVGANPVTYDSLPATTLTIGQTFGEEKHKLLPNEIAQHFHQTPVLVSNETNLGQAWTNLNGTTPFGTPQRTLSINGSNQNDVMIPNSGYNLGTGSAISTQLSHNTMPPVLAVYFVKRTARIYYTVP